MCEPLSGQFGTWVTGGLSVGSQCLYVFTIRRTDLELRSEPGVYKWLHVSLCQAPSPFSPWPESWGVGHSALLHTFCHCVTSRTSGQYDRKEKQWVYSTFLGPQLLQIKGKLPLPLNFHHLWALTATVDTAVSIAMWVCLEAWVWENWGKRGGRWSIPSAVCIFGDLYFTPSGITELEGFSWNPLCAPWAASHTGRGMPEKTGNLLPIWWRLTSGLLLQSAS